MKMLRRSNCTVVVAALVQVLLQIVLLASILHVNIAAPSTHATNAAVVVAVDNNNIQLSSPAPFSIATNINGISATLSSRLRDETTNQTPQSPQNAAATATAAASTAAAAATTTYRTRTTPINLDSAHSAVTREIESDNDDGSGSIIHYDENDPMHGITFVSPSSLSSSLSSSSSSPTSVEQQDQPLWTISSETDSENSSSGNGNVKTNIDNNNNGVTVNDATPPYDAVDDKYVPSKPENLTVLDVTATTITMSWHPPKNQNGAIAGYHVFHIHENQTGVEIVKNVRNSIESTITFVLPKLKPFTDYRIIVKAFTTKNEGEPSDQIVQRTDIDGANAPNLLNVSCHSQDSIRIRWKRPTEFYNTIDFYKIRTRNIAMNTHHDDSINTSSNELEMTMILPNMTTDMEYEIKVAAATTSIINPTKYVLGKFSDYKRIFLQPNCEKIQPLLRQSHNDYDMAVLVGIIFSCFGIVLIVMAFFLWSRKCFHAAYYYLDDPPHHPNMPQVDWEVPVEVAGEIRSAVPVNEFAKHVASLHADGDIGFSREYEAIQNDGVNDDLPCEHSQHPENKRKNRYLNITAYDHSRVHLHPTPGQKKSLDYINANFIDGYQRARAFIGTQGPLPDTFDCFWRMIWEQRVAIIIMITNLVERGRRKCDMYWPKDGIETYGVIQVKLVEEEVMSTYTVRTLQIKHLKLKKKKQCNIEKIVYQYHYTNWPDHGTPDHPLPVLNFVKKSSAANPADAGPIVVHCSAGVGRTGTYIVLDAMLKQIQRKGVVNVFGFLRHIRIQRNFLVQTEEQYIFIHDALVEAIASGETNLRAEQIEELKNCTPYLEQQYKNIIQFQTKDIHIASAMKQVNSIKNRGAIFPIEGSRVHLTPKPGEEGSDYINASWLHGFRRLRDFIVTQHPMTHTIKDFWQMVWDHNAQTIVLLSSLDEINFAQFWPDDTTPIESDYYRVKFVSKTNKSDYVSRDFVIQSIQDDYELNVKMLHCPSWPEMTNPSSIFDFIVDVHERCNDYRNGPIVVVDRYGGAQACTFCAISSLSIEMEYCNTANIYQYSKLYHNKRPGVWTSSEDIRLIYNILSYLPRNLQLLKRTALRTEFEDVTTATPDLYSKICSNGNINSTTTTATQKLITSSCGNYSDNKLNSNDSSNDIQTQYNQQLINNCLQTNVNPLSITKLSLSQLQLQQQSQQNQNQQQQQLQQQIQAQSQQSPTTGNFIFPIHSMTENDVNEFTINTIQSTTAIATITSNTPSTTTASIITPNSVLSIANEFLDSNINFTNTTNAATTVITSPTTTSTTTTSTTTTNIATVPALQQPPQQQSHEPIDMVDVNANNDVYTLPIGDNDDDDDDDDDYDGNLDGCTTNGMLTPILKSTTTTNMQTTSSLHNNGDNHHNHHHHQQQHHHDSHHHHHNHQHHHHHHHHHHDDDLSQNNGSGDGLTPLLLSPPTPPPQSTMATSQLTDNHNAMSMSTNSIGASDNDTAAVTDAQSLDIVG